jgi:DNA-directed RNA polymerase specialized sigma24 family protein
MSSEERLQAVPDSVPGLEPADFSRKESSSRKRLERAKDPASPELSIRDSLVQMIRRLTPNLALREDLLQEATVHLWLTETRRPGQTRSWYLQSCRFHLQHYLNFGRSIDSAKRWRDQLPISEFSEDLDSSRDRGDSGNSVFTCVSAREIMSLLTPHLTTQERAVLNCLAEGLGAREIGRKLKLSHTMAIRHRRKIAQLFNRLELQPAESIQFPQTNGFCHHNGNGRLTKKTQKTGSSSC